jgi:hypothetical protein
MNHPMRGLYDLCRSPRGKLALNLAIGLFAVAISVLAARHFAGIGWPFSGANAGLVAAAGVLFVVAYAFKAFGWHRLFAPHERPQPLTLGAACGAASVTGAALPGRFDDVVRVAVVRRATNGRAGVAPVCLSLFMLGLIDTAALMPLAGTAAATADASGAARHWPSSPSPASAPPSSSPSSRA